MSDSLLILLISFFNIDHIQLVLYKFICQRIKFIISVISICREVIKIKQLIENKKYIYLMIIVSAFTISLFKNPEIVKQGVFYGLKVVYETMLPSLFPIMIICGFTIKSGLFKILSKPFGKLTRTLFKLPEEIGSAIVLSFLCGYTSAAIIIKELYRQKRLTKLQCETLSSFAIIGGPGYIILAIGTGIFKNQYTGFILYFSQLIAAIIVGIIISRRNSNDDQNKKYESTECNPISALTISVSESIINMSVIAGYTVISSIIINLFLNSTVYKLAMALICAKYNSFTCNLISGILTGLVDVSFGSIKLVENSSVFSIYVICVLCSFSGLSVIMQTSSILSSEGISAKKYLKSRFFHATISCIIFSILIKIFPLSIETFSNMTGNELFSLYAVSPRISISLVLLLVMLIFSLCSKPSKNTLYF